MHPLKSAIERLAVSETAGGTTEARQVFLEFREQLTKGKIRAAEKIDGEWRVNIWVKEGILLGFRIGELSETGTDAGLSFVDKDTFPARRITIKDRVRLDKPLEVPENAVVVPGSRALKKGHAAEWGLSLYAPVIVKYRDEKTDQRIELEEWLR